MTREQRHDLTVRLAEGVMKWRVRVNKVGVTFADYAPPDEHGNPRSYLLFQHSAVYRTWDPTRDLTDAWMIVETLNKRGIEVIIGVLRRNVCVELRHWRKPTPEQQAAGTTGDPYTGRIRVTFVCETGESVPETICAAADRPEVYALLRAGDGGPEVGRA